MKNIFFKSLSKTALLALGQLLLAATLFTYVYAAESRLNNIREGLYSDHSRIVLDCSGDLPKTIGPKHAEYLLVQFTELDMAVNLGRVTQRLRGAVNQIGYQKSNGGGAIKLTYKAPGPRVTSFVLRSENSKERSYRIVLDIFPGKQISKPEVTQKSVEVMEKAAASAPAAIESVTSSSAGLPVTEQVVTGAAAVARSQSIATSPSISPQAPVEDAIEPKSPTAMVAAASDDTVEPEAVETEESGDEEQSDVVYSAEASLILRAADGEDESAKFEEYRDISQSVSGDVAVKATKGQRYHIKAKATGIGREDQFAGVEAGDYSGYDVHLGYDNTIHRHGFNARTLYSGVGSGGMTLDDVIQTSVQAAPTPVDTANLLSGLVTSAASIGDPEVTRDTLKLGLNVFALDPFNIKLELTNEKRQGTRPYAGAFSSTQMVELFEPIDYDTLGMKISGGYAHGPGYLDIAYQFSQFTNNTDTLSFDNPLIVTDAAGASSSGMIDLAPDNQSHNLSVSGAYTQLPWNSQITANAAWGLMTQDDDLVPFTTNTAIVAPALPVDSVDAKVQTTLYSLRLTSKPLSFMRVKGHFRYYDYDNQTDQINFSGGYVETDAFTTATPITNLPSSYTKTRTGLDFGFDVMKRTHLGLGYKYIRTDRENREVEEQNDHIVKLSADNRTLEWLDFRASYERTDREIGVYNFDVYQDSGDDLDQLPQLRKYDQADMVRDRFQVQTTVYPVQALSLSGSFTYGTDDFKDSPYGLGEDNHYIFSFDTDYAVGERATVNLFYNFEKYENAQRANDGAADWTAQGEDQVNTIGGGLTLDLIPNRLDLGLTYAYSDVDGTIAFTSPSGTFADFTAYDDTQLHALDTKVKYHFSQNLTLSLGYLWEKFDYEDLSTEGFSPVPTDASGNYQGALLSGTLPEDYDVHIVYTQVTFRYQQGK